MGDVALGNLPATLPLYIPEIEIGGIRLMDQPGLQLESLLKASSVILESIDDSLGLGATASSNGSSSGAQPQGLLLDALLGQSDLVYQKADGTREARVKQTISQIHQFLDSARK
ncbi:uncharacterized protein LY89DRAFT_689796 [Mollisia scopiformis]|uniref:Uncharacterized protein n=1 Tax=Mollisia scopiformis TaxID=149040 RepID=A0A132BBY5_MOLSC|nr:uncharacterized protein LY89DRAFT_689796 [Mollisia scopiformis]KUJ09888.1 hypothetical protein LY89DRAFT_689796 [Mollisia scopiformis]